MTGTPSRPATGFTLIELLVVIVIIGILLGVATLSLNTSGPDRQVRREAQRISSLLQQASEEAVLTAQEIGVRFNDTGFHFTFLDSTGWQAYEGDDLLRKRELPPGMHIDLWLDGLKVSLSEGEGEAPQVFLLSSGETTPFELRIQDDDSRIGYRLQGDPFGVITLAAEATP